MSMRKGDKKPTKKQAPVEEKKSTAREELFLLQQRLVKMERKISFIHRWVLWRRIIGWTQVVLIVLVILGGAQLYRTHFPKMSAAFSDYKKQVDEVFGIFEQRDTTPQE